MLILAKVRSFASDCNTEPEADTHPNMNLLHCVKGRANVAHLPAKVAASPHIRENCETIRRKCPKHAKTGSLRQYIICSWDGQPRFESNGRTRIEEFYQIVNV